MTPKQYYQLTSRDDVESVAEAAGTTFSNFQQIALAGGSVGKKLAEKLAECSNGQMTELEILYPERYEDADTNTNSSAA